jgi:D-alanyl-D-alanine carboxypeptidase/D-alanyl-D-alanine-endopeptidase (penicillin-binding protein 4)
MLGVNEHGFGAMSGTSGWVARVLKWLSKRVDQSATMVRNGVRNFASSMKNTSFRTPLNIVALICLFAICALPDATAQQRFSPPVRTQYDSARALRTLRGRLDNIFTSGAYRNGRTSVSVWSITRGTSIYERNHLANLTPASTTKLFTTASVFQLYGAGSSVTTDVRYDGTLGSDGTLRGNLYIIGHGDALLSVNDLEELADKVRTAGITRVTGNVYGDGSAFESQSNRAVYSGDFEDVVPLPPVVALNVNRGTIAVVASAGRSGTPSVQIIPASDAVELVVRATKAAAPSTPQPRKRSARRAPPTSKRKSSKKRTSTKRRADVYRVQEDERFGDAPPEPRQRRRGRRTRIRVSASSTLLPNGTQRIAVNGNPGRNSTATVYVNAAKPALFTAGVFVNRLRSGGVTVDGTVLERQAPSNARMLAQFRRPLTEIAGVVNKRSDNYIAEHLFKLVGATCGDHTTTAARARRTVLDVLDTLGVQRNGCVFNDGSGLSRRNLVSAATQVQLLRKIYALPWGREYRSTLAIAAYDGTIRGRMHGTPAANNVTAKTGTLRNVSSLSGYVTTADGELLAFSFMSNGPAVGTYKQLESLAAATLAAFSYGGSAALDIQLNDVPLDTNAQPEGE